MAIDLNQTGEQGTPNQVIPPMSKVVVKLCVKIPEDPARNGTSYGLTKSRHSSLEYLATTLEVAAGTFKGSRVFHNFNVSGATSDSHRRAIDISLRSLRALVEAAKGISPKDASPQATAARQLNNWTDVDGLVFPIVVDCEESLPNRDGRVFINNKLKSIVTSLDADYQTLMSGGEVLSGQPVPEPKKGNTDATQSAQTWAAPPASSPAAPAGQAAFTPPDWTQRGNPAPTASQTAQPSEQGFTPPPAWATPGAAWAAPTDVPF